MPIHKISTDSAQENPQELALTGMIGQHPDTKHGVTSILLDVGAQVNCIAEKYVQLWNLTRIKLTKPRVARSYEGVPTETITHRVEFYLLINDHKEHTEALVTRTYGKHELILGHTWRATHEPTISYQTGLVRFNSTYCRGTCNPMGLVPEIFCRGFQPTNKSNPPPYHALNKTHKGLPTEAESKDANARHGIDIRLVSRKAIQCYARVRGSTTYLLPCTTRLDAGPSTQVCKVKVATDEDYERTKKGPDFSDPTEHIPPEYHEKIKLFSRNSANKLAERSPHDHEIRIKPGAKLPNAKLRPLSPQQLEAIRDHIEEMEQKGFIEKANSPVRSNLLITQKPGGGIRICVDYRELNEATIKDRYPIPFFRETISRICKANYFSKFDIIHAFNRIQIKEGCEWLTAFTTRWGTYQYKVMPFGLCNAPATFQRAINEAFAGYFDDFVTAYLDDILVYSKTLEEHRTHVLQVLDRLLERGFYLDVKKSVFNTTRVNYLGLIITNNGIEMDLKKVDAIRSMECPQPPKVSSPS